MIKRNVHFVNLFFLFLILGFNISEGQVVDDRATQVNTNKALVDIMTKVQGLDNAKKVEVEGSPYLTDEWHMGSITTSSGTTFTDIELKYDLYHEQLIYNDKKANDIFAVNMKILDEFSLFGVDTIRFVRNGLLMKDLDAQFYQLLFKGNPSLLKVLKKEVLKFDSDSSSPTSSQPRLITRNSLFLVKDNSFCEIKKSRKKALSCFGQHETELEKFAKNNKINFGDEQDVIKVFHAYESF